MTSHSSSFTTNEKLPAISKAGPHVEHLIVSAEEPDVILPPPERSRKAHVAPQVMYGARHKIASRA
ncbi:hypothetical protein EYF80_001505 [Liparis tanakae]|uniref:Uncharacterized protein n=1 Tax=Liparis tanakae TaxID=230148 RepID=A0A4Z2JDI8_9TELE|nr:hypothetical protein EYF80_001505 [Liparis tanakae]